jgi:cytochrome c oxidase subunit 2
MISTTTSISGRVVENVFIYIGLISVFLLMLIAFLIIYFVIRYRAKKNPHPADIRGSVWLEIVWTAVPTFLVLTMFYYGLTGFERLRKVPEGAMKIRVTSRMWSWGFEYENGMKVEDLKVPVGKPIHLILTSEDVIHSFYVPALRIKQDALPGMENHLWFEATRAGTYDVLCAEYCGLRHSYMLTKLVVLSEEEFNAWYESGLKKKGARKATPPGAQLFQEKGCRACHSTDGAPGAGPTLKGIFGKSVVVLTEGKERTLVADEAYLRKSILEPNADVVKGFPSIMPAQKMPENEIDHLIHYMKELK